MPTSPAGGGRRRPPGAVSPPGRAAPRVRGFVSGPPGLAEVEVEVVAESSGRGLRAAGCGQLPRRRRRRSRSRSCPPPPSLPSFREAEAGSLLSSRAREEGRAGGARGAGTLSPATRSCQAVSQAWRRPPPAPSPSGLSPFMAPERRRRTRGPALCKLETNQHTTRHHLPKTAWPPGRPKVHRHGAGGHLGDGRPGPGRERRGSGATDGVEALRTDRRASSRG